MQLRGKAVALSAAGVAILLLFATSYVARNRIRGWWYSGFVDAVKADKAEVVLRVKRLSGGDGSKYWWYDVEVLMVLKNDSTEWFTNRLSVAADGGKRGVPGGISTIYLERYNPVEKKHWKLVGGEASTGASHY